MMILSTTTTILYTTKKNDGERECGPLAAPQEIVYLCKFNETETKNIK